MSTNENLISIEEIAEKIHNSYSKIGKEKLISSIILSTKREERTKIREFYDNKFNANLLNDIESNFSSDLGDFAKVLFMTRTEQDKELIDGAIGVFSIDNPILYEILFNRPKWIKDQIKEEYTKQGNDLQSILEEALKFNCKIRKNVKHFLNIERTINRKPNTKKCEENAKKLISVDSKNWLENEEIMKDIFAKCSPEEIVSILQKYKKLTGKSLNEEIKKLPKAEKEFFTCFLQNIISPPQMFAKYLNDSVRGFGTDEKVINRIIAYRYDVDMPLIKIFYEKMYNTSLIKDLEDDTNHDHFLLLEGLVNYLSID